MNEKKHRLDHLVADLGLARSRQRSRALIMAGRILVNRQPVEKPGMLVSKSDEIILRGDEPLYVSRGGLKLRAMTFLETGIVPVDLGPAPRRPGNRIWGFPVTGKTFIETNP